jgi:hypothetical protein
MEIVFCKTLPRTKCNGPGVIYHSVEERGRLRSL